MADVSERLENGLLYRAEIPRGAVDLLPRREDRACGSERLLLLRLRVLPRALGPRPSLGVDAVRFSACVVGDADSIGLGISAELDSFLPDAFSVGVRRPGRVGRDLGVRVSQPGPPRLTAA